MGVRPMAGKVGILVDKGHIQMTHTLEYLHNLAFFSGRLGFDHRFRRRGRQKIGPELSHRLLQIPGGQFL